MPNIYLKVIIETSSKLQLGSKNLSPGQFLGADNTGF